MTSPLPRLLYLVACGFALVLVAGKCEPSPEIPLEKIPGVPERYWFLYEGNWPSSKEEEHRARGGLTYSEISLERRGSPGPPSYVIVLKKDGTATFNGLLNSPRQGMHRGEVDLDDFGRLCYLLERLNIEKLSTDLRKSKDHGSAGTAAVIRASGSDKKIQSWEISGCGAIELWAIQMTIDAIAAKIEWTPEKDSKADGK